MGGTKNVGRLCDGGILHVVTDCKQGRAGLFSEGVGCWLVNGMHKATMFGFSAISRSVISHRENHDWFINCECHFTNWFIGSQEDVM